MKKAINFQITRNICTTAILAVSLFSSASYADSLMASGQWKDPNTGLIWMRCSLGQKWNGDTCTGKAIKLTLSDAFEYARRFINEKQRFGGYSNWRVPTMAELMTIRHCSNDWVREKVSELTESGRVTRLGEVRMTTVPGATGSVTVPVGCAWKSGRHAINTRIFPATARGNYSSSSSRASNNSICALNVDFSNGYENVNCNKDSSQYVRLVRGE